METIVIDKPCVGKYLDFFPKSNEKILIYNRLNQKAYSVGKREYTLLILLDGNKSLGELSAICDYFSICEIETLINCFNEMGFLSNGKTIKKEFNIFRLKKRIVNPDKIINPNSFIVKILYFFICYLPVPIFIIGLVVTFNNFNITTQAITNTVNWANIILIIPIVCIVISMHELAHAIVAKCNGAYVAELGIMLYNFMPSAYTSIIGKSYIHTKFKRLQILMAGILLNMQLIGFGLITLQFATGFVYSFFIVFVGFNIVTIISNISILEKVDGYYILEEILNIKDLKEKSLSYYKCLFNRKKVGCTDFTKSNNVAYILYGVFSALYIVFCVAIAIMIIVLIKSN